MGFTNCYSSLSPPEGRRAVVRVGKMMHIGFVEFPFVTETTSLHRLCVVPIVAPTAFPDRAVNVELTDLEVLDKRYWSLGLEAFPDDSNMPSAFFHVAETLLGTLSGVDLKLENSHSYPSWLMTLRLTE